MLFLKSFKSAFEGIIHCIKTERNMRIHIVAMIYVIIFCRFYNLSRTQWAILFLTLGAVISAEIFNTTAERLCDSIVSNYSIQAKIIKDLAAGAVLICAIFALCVGIALFWDTAVFIEIFNYFCNNIIAIILLLISLVLSVLFVNGK